MPERQNWLERIAEVKATNHIPVIAEIKPSSPGAGELLGQRSIPDIVKDYVNGGAACISVVTGRWFGGNLDLLALVAQQTSLPLLRKDLIVNLDQIKKSIDYGANAVLLTKKVLQKSHLEKMIDLCISLNVTSFIEVASAEEIDSLPINPGVIIGIANRDIAQKEMDVDSGLQSVALINSAKHKAGAIISASGIRNQHEANMLFDAGFDGLLVGTSLLQAQDTSLALQRLSTRTTSTIHSTISETDKTEAAIA